MKSLSNLPLSIPPTTLSKFRLFKKSGLGSFLPNELIEGVEDYIFGDLDRYEYLNKRLTGSIQANSLIDEYEYFAPALKMVEGLLDTVLWLVYSYIETGEDVLYFLNLFEYSLKNASPEDKPHIEAILKWFLNSKPEIKEILYDNIVGTLEYEEDSYLAIEELEQGTFDRDLEIAANPEDYYDKDKQNIKEVEHTLKFLREHIWKK